MRFPHLRNSDWSWLQNIVESIRYQQRQPKRFQDPDVYMPGRGMRAKMNRLWKKGLIEPAEPAGIRTTRYGRRMLRLWRAQFPPVTIPTEPFPRKSTL